LAVRLRTAIAPQLHTAALGCCKRGLRPGRDHAGLKLQQEFAGGASIMGRSIGPKAARFFIGDVPIRDRVLRLVAEEHRQFVSWTAKS
jgi:hypothetical protein